MSSRDTSTRNTQMVSSGTGQARPLEPNRRFRSGLLFNQQCGVLTIRVSCRTQLKMAAAAAAHVNDDLAGRLACLSGILANSRHVT